MYNVRLKTDRVLEVFRADTGTRLYSINFEGQIAGSPIIQGDTISITVRVGAVTRNEFYCLKTGQRKNTTY